MLGESKGQKSNITDTNTTLAKYAVRTLETLSYTKTNKLVTALYMITDIMDRNEPLRNKLRDLGSNIISDIYQLKGQSGSCDAINKRISETLSFLEIASGVGIISEMNSSIISKEFIELRKAIVEFVSLDEQNWLEEFIKEAPLGSAVHGALEGGKTFTRLNSEHNKSISNGRNGTRIGVQKGGTLMRALSDRIPELSYLSNGQAIKRQGQKSNSSMVLNKNNNYELKNKRREDIIFAIKDKAKNSINFDGATITDIKSIGHGSLVSCGEKTLQRELVAMVMEGILRKKGEKRWSRYSL